MRTEWHRMLSRRLITGPILILILLLVVWWDAWLGPVTLGETQLAPGIALLGISMVVAALAVLELCAIANATGRSTSPILTIFAVEVLLIVLWGGAAESDTGVILLVIVATWFASLWQHARGQRTQGVFNDAATTTAITLYVGGCLGFLLLLRHDVSAWWIAAVVLITKSCDIGAYFTGCSIGRHKLIPWVSPGKTVEGLIGGLAMAAGIAVLASFVLANYGYAEISWPRAIVLGVLLGLAGQAGDLSMSLLKRDAEVKDCSDTIPGMGGIMDVLDSLLLAAPVAWLYLR